MRQVVIRRLAEKLNRLAELIKLAIGAYRGELRRPVTPGISAKSFVVVPQKHHWNRSAFITNINYAAG